MKKHFLLLVLTLSGTFLFSQAPINKGMSQINIGFGFSNRGIPLYASYDYAVVKNVTLGGQLSFSNFGDGTYSHSIFGINAIGNYHFNRLLDMPTNWNLYAGVNLGYYFWSNPVGYQGSYSSGFASGAQIGARYYFNKRFGVNLEFGGGTATSGGKIGITYTLRK